MVSTIAEPVLIAVISLAVGLAGIAKGATGLGFPIVAVPIIAVFVPVEHAVVVVTLPNLVVNAALVREHRRRAAVMPWLKVMITTGMIGAVLGTLMLRAAPERALSIVLSALIGIYLLLRWLRPDLQLSERSIRRTAPIVGLLGGLLQGVSGFSGPLIGTYVHAWRLEREAYVFAVSVLFMLFATVQLVTMLPAGMVTPARAAQSFSALPSALLGTAVGIRLGRRMDAAVFERLITITLALIGLRLLWVGLV